MHLSGEPRLSESDCVAGRSHAGLKFNHKTFKVNGGRIPGALETRRQRRLPRRGPQSKKELEDHSSARASRQFPRPRTFRWDALSRIPTYLREYLIEYVYTSHVCAPLAVATAKIWMAFRATFDVSRFPSPTIDNRVARDRPSNGVRLRLGSCERDVCEVNVSLISLWPRRHFALSHPTFQRRRSATRWC